MELFKHKRNEDAENKGSANMSRRKFLRNTADLALNVAAVGGLGVILSDMFKDMTYRGKIANEITMYEKQALQSASKGELMSQFDRAEEPRLIKKIERGDVRTTLDVVNYFGNKPVVGEEDSTRIDYVRFAISFDKKLTHVSDIPQWEQVQEHLRPLIPGLCAQESRFDNNARSRAGAEGIFQFMPTTWEELSAQIYRADVHDKEAPPTRLKITSLKDETRAAGKHLSNIYNQLQYYASKELAQIETIVFPHGGFEEFFLAPLVINAHNAGSKRLAEAVKAFAEVFQTPHDAHHSFSSQLNYDAFYALTQIAKKLTTGTHAQYNNESAQYVPRVLAGARLIENE